LNKYDPASDVTLGGEDYRVFRRSSQEPPRNTR